MRMVKRTFVPVIVLIWLCGCESSDPYVRRSEFLKEGKQMAQTQANAAVATLDEKVDSTVSELRLALDENTKSVSALQSGLDALAKRNAESVSALKSTLEASTTQTGSSIKQNAESIAALKSTIDDFTEDSGKSIAGFGTGLEQLREEVSQFRLDVQQEFSKHQADRTATTDQLAEQTNQLVQTTEQLAGRTDRLTKKTQQLDSGLRRAFLLLQEARAGQEPLSEPVIPPAEMPAGIERTSQAKYGPGLEPAKQGFILSLPTHHRLLFVGVGLMVIGIGFIVAELSSRAQRKLARSLGRRQLH